MSVVEGHRSGPCLLVAPAAPQSALVQRTLDALVRVHGRPAVVQTDRGPCFVGAAGGATRAPPGRVTPWLWGPGLARRLIPPGNPQRNGAVERSHGAVERNRRGEPDGLAALIAVWNRGKPSTAARLAPHRGRAGCRRERAWARREGVRAERKVDAQGKFSPWDRPIRAGRRLAGRDVSVTFDAARRAVVLRDRREVGLAERPLPWLTADWSWAPLTPPACDPHDSPTFG